MKKEELEKLAKKFAELAPKAQAAKKAAGKDSDKTVKDYLIELGMSAEEIKELPNCPRTGSMSSAGTWIKIGGYQTYPMSWCLTQEEYNKYKELKGSPSGSRTKSSANDDKLREDLLAAIEEAKKVKGAEKLVEILEGMLPLSSDQQKLINLLVAQGYDEATAKNIALMKK